MHLNSFLTKFPPSILQVEKSQDIAFLLRSLLWVLVEYDDENMVSTSTIQSRYMDSCNYQNQKINLLNNKITGNKRVLEKVYLSCIKIFTLYSSARKNISSILLGKASFDIIQTMPMSVWEILRGNIQSQPGFGNILDFNSEVSNSFINFALGEGKIKMRSEDKSVIYKWYRTYLKYNQSI